MLDASIRSREMKPRSGFHAVTAPTANPRPGLDRADRSALGRSHDEPSPVHSYYELASLATGATQVTVSVWREPIRVHRRFSPGQPICDIINLSTNVQKHIQGCATFGYGA